MNASSPMEPLGSLSFSLLDGEEEELKFYWAGSHHTEPGVQVWIGSKQDHVRIVPVSKSLAAFVSHVREPVVKAGIVLHAAIKVYREDIEDEKAARLEGLKKQYRR